MSDAKVRVTPLEHRAKWARVRTKYDDPPAQPVTERRIGWQLRRTCDGSLLCVDGEWRTYIPMGTPGARLFKSPAGAAAKARTLEFVTETEKVER